MELLATLQTDLRGLSAEARKKYPQVKEVIYFPKNGRESISII
jgi:hypothetical protein